jgi:hypothetical protein
MLKPGINININNWGRGFTAICLGFFDALAATWWNQCPHGQHPNISY